MNNTSSSMFSLGKKTYTKSFDKVLINTQCIDSSAYISKKQKQAIGKPMHVSNNFITHSINKNDVVRAKRITRSAGTVAPPKSNVYPR